MVGVASLAAFVRGERVLVFLVRVVFLAGAFFVVLAAVLAFEVVLRGARVFLAAAVVVVLRVRRVLAAAFFVVVVVSFTGSASLFAITAGGSGGGGGGACGDRCAA